MPPRDKMATSVVPPPMSTTIDPVGSVTGRPAPSAAAIGSSIRNTRRAPALSALSWMARRSTAVEPEGTQITTRGLAKPRRGCTRRMKCLIISSATSKSAISPVAQGADRLDVAGGAPDHLLGFLANGEDLTAATAGGQRHHRRLVQDDAAALVVDQRVGGAEIDRHVGGKQAEQSRKHGAIIRGSSPCEPTEAGGAVLAAPPTIILFGAGVRTRPWRRGTADRLLRRWRGGGFFSPLFLRGWGA